LRPIELLVTIVKKNGFEEKFMEKALLVVHHYISEKADD